MGHGTRCCGGRQELGMPSATRSAGASGVLGGEPGGRFHDVLDREALSTSRRIDHRRRSDDDNASRTR